MKLAIDSGVSVLLCSILLSLKNRILLVIHILVAYSDDSLNAHLILQPQNLLNSKVDVKGERTLKNLEIIRFEAISLSPLWIQCS